MRFELVPQQFQHGLYRIIHGDKLLIAHDVVVNVLPIAPFDIPIQNILERLPRGHSPSSSNSCSPGARSNPRTETHAASATASWITASVVLKAFMASATVTGWSCMTAHVTRARPMLSTRPPASSGSRSIISAVKTVPMVIVLVLGACRPRHVGQRCFCGFQEW